MSLYAVGDVQGCWDSLAALLEQIGYDRARDRLWVTGDLVNRGPRSLEVLRWARAEQQAGRLVTVLGNHDLHLLARAAGVRSPGRRDTLDAVLAAPDCDQLIDWLRRQPLCHRDGDRLLVHAGLLPPWSAADAEQLAREVEAELAGPRWTRLLGSWRDAPERWRPDLAAGARRQLALSALVTVRTVRADGSMERRFNGAPADAPPGCVPWFEHPARRSRDVRVVCGHWAALGLCLRDDVAALDSGCVWGGQLTALRLDDDRVFQQDALERRPTDRAR